MPAGTLMLNFDPSEDVPAEFVMKASRYGWPAASELVPVFLTVDGTEPGEPGRDEVRVLAVALAALLEHDAAGPTLVEVGPKVTSGKLELAEGEQPRSASGNCPGSKMTQKSICGSMLPAPIYCRSARP